MSRGDSSKLPPFLVPRDPDAPPPAADPSATHLPTTEQVPVFNDPQLPTPEQRQQYFDCLTTSWPANVPFPHAGGSDADRVVTRIAATFSTDMIIEVSGVEPLDHVKAVFDDVLNTMLDMRADPLGLDRLTQPQPAPADPPPPTGDDGTDRGNRGLE